MLVLFFYINLLLNFNIYILFFGWSNFFFILLALLGNNLGSKTILTGNEFVDMDPFT